MKPLPPTILQFERSTKNTHVYTAVGIAGQLGTDAPIQSLYIRKSAFNGDAPPTFIRLEVTEEPTSND